MFGQIGEDEDDKPRGGLSLPKPVVLFLESPQGQNFVVAASLTLLVGGIAVYWFYAFWGNPFTLSK